jgi:hypothetical protein
VAVYPILYLACLIGGCGYAAWRGGAPERWGAGIVLGATMLSNIAAIRSGHPYLATDTLYFAIDVGVAAAFLVLACIANRFWPLWTAMLQLDAVFTEIVMLAHSTPPFSYGLALRLFAFPLPLLVGIGAHRHWRRTSAAAGRGT